MNRDEQKLVPVSDLAHWQRPGGGEIPSSGFLPGMTAAGFHFVLYVRNRTGFPFRPVKFSSINPLKTGDLRPRIGSQREKLKLPAETVSVFPSGSRISAVQLAGIVTENTVFPSFLSQPLSARPYALL